MDVRGQLGRAIQRFRRARGISQEDLAGESEIDRAYVGRLERGEANPTLLLLARLSRALDAPLVELLRDLRCDLPDAIPEPKSKRRRSHHRRRSRR
jgi:transcriptional regulator with XRE-family HTH domain